MIIHGNNVILASPTSGISFAMAKSCDLEIQADLVEVSSPNAGGWRSYMNDRKSWTVRLNHLVGAIKTNADMVGQKIVVQIFRRGLGSDGVSGEAIVEQWKVTATRGNLAAGSFVLRGTGALA